jgi:hypothetical protein
VNTLQQAEADVAESRPPWTRTAAAQLDTAMHSVVAVRSNELLSGALRFDPTVLALRMLAARMATVPGRKNLIWITHGVPIAARDVSGEPIDLTRDVRNLAAELVRSHIAVHAVAQSAQGAGVGFNDSVAMLRVISSWTGGRAFGSDNAEEAINESIRDARSTYVVAYERPAQKKNPKYYKLQVTCDRKGMRILSRQGDLDVADMPLSKPEVQAAIDSAARATLDSPDIGVQAQISSTGAGPNAFRVSVRIDPRDVFLRQGADGGFSGQLFLVVAGYEDGGLKELPPPEQWNVGLKAQEYEESLQNGIEHATAITPSQSTQKIRCIVMDRELNAVGSVTVPLPGRGAGHLGRAITGDAHARIT